MSFLAPRSGARIPIEAARSRRGVARQPIAARTRSRVNGTVVSRAPMASNTAFASAAGTGVADASPAPSGGSCGRITMSTRISGASGNRRIG